MKVCADAYARGVLGIHEHDRCFSVAKLFFAYGLGNSMYFPLAVGATTILWPGAVAAPTVNEIIERYRPTLFFSVPTHYAMLLAHTVPEREFDLSSLRAAVSAGEALPRRCSNDFAIASASRFSTASARQSPPHLHFQSTGCSPGSSGIPVPGTRPVWSTNPASRSRLASWGTCRARRLDLCLLLEPPRADERHHQRTLDSDRRQYRQDDDGFFWFAGRSDDMLKVGGIWVSPAEVEHLMLEHPAVQACGVTGREDQDGLIKPVAHVVPCAGREPGAELMAKLDEFDVNALPVQAPSLD